MALNNEDKKDVKAAFGKKIASAVSIATQDHPSIKGVKRPANPDERGHPDYFKNRAAVKAGFEASRGKKENLAKKIGPSGYRISGEPPPRSRTSDAAAGGINR